MGFCCVESTRADTLISVIKDVFLRFNFPLSEVRVQCYDGASTMSGYKSGVTANLLQEEPKALYTHCYGHALNLACADAIKHNKVMKDTLDTAHEIVKLIKYFPKRQSSFMTLKAELAPGTPGVRSLCPTRWTVRGQALQSIVDNYNVLTDLWLDSLSEVKDTEMKARIHGVASQMKNFDFFGVSLSELILRHSDNLSRTLQKESISAAEGQEVTSLTVTTLRSLRTEDSWKMFWAKAKRIATDVNVAEPQLPCRRKVPRRLEEGATDTHFPATAEDHYRQIYFQALDDATTCICH